MSFFGGGFFGSGFFGEGGEAETPKTGGKGDNGRRKSIYKPTGLPPYRSPVVEKRVAETHQIAREVIEAIKEKPIPSMSLAEIDAEIGTLIRKKTEEEEITLLLLLAASA